MRMKGVLAKKLTRHLIKIKKNCLTIWILRMDKRKRNLNLRDLPVLVNQVAVVVKVRRVMILTANTVIEKTTKLNRNIWTKNINQKVLNGNEGHGLEIEVDHIQGQSAVGHVPGIGVIHVQDIIDDLRTVINQDAVGHLFHVMEVPESIKANVIVHLVQMNQEVLNIGIGDNILVKTLFWEINFNALFYE